MGKKEAFSPPPPKKKSNKFQTPKDKLSPPVKMFSEYTPCAKGRHVPEEKKSL